jgi:hypothetical protein
MIKVNGHTFVNHKSEEMICWACGFVLGGQELDEAEVIEQLKEGQISLQQCPNKWHGFTQYDDDDDDDE